MNFSPTQLEKRLDELPMLRVLIPVVCGILVADTFRLPILFLVGALLITGLLTLLLKSNLYALVLLFFGAFLSCELHHTTLKPPLHQEVTLRLRVDHDPVERTGYASTTGRVEAWCEAEGRWQPSTTRTTLYCDSTLRPRAGEELTLRGRIRPYSTRYPGYAELMRRRGFAGTLSLSEWRILERDTTPRFTLAEKLHHYAVAQIEKLPLKEKNRAVVAAMVAGEKRQLTPELRSAYSRSGTSHLLAVSGLHVGILFFSLNLLFGWLPLLRGGHLLRNGLMIIAIWLFAAMTGFSPSVLRAAWMFSFLQLSMLFTLPYRGLNTLFAVAVGLLLYRPSWLYDPGFQLSFLAVTAILSWAAPWLTHRRGGGHYLRESLVVGVAATLATAPLISLRFGIISLLGVVVNPLAILLSQGIVTLTLGWILLPLKPLAGIIGRMIDLLTSGLNGLVEWVAAREFAALDFRLSATATLLIYLVFIAFTLRMWGLEAKKSVSLPRDDDDDFADDDL